MRTRLKVVRGEHVMIDNPRNRTSPMDELDEDELFTVCLDDDGHPVQRAVRRSAAALSQIPCIACHRNCASACARRYRRRGAL